MRDIMITSSILILAVLGIRFLTKGKISPLLQYALWLVVVMRLCLPVPLGNSTVSILNYLPDSVNVPDGGNSAQNMDMPDNGSRTQNIDMPDNASRTRNMDMLDNSNEAHDMNRSGNGNGAQNMGMSGSGSTAYKVETFDLSGGPYEEKQAYVFRAEALRDVLWHLCPVVWAAGMIVMASYMLFYQIKWMRYLSIHRKALKSIDIGPDLAGDFDRDGKYKGKLSVYTLKGLPSPCLSGRNIYLTKEMAESERQFAHILAHEYCHYRHGDSFWIFLRCALLCVYWFHPLVWVAAGVSKQDGELACDVAAVRMLGEEERLAYGRTLLCLIAANEYGWNNAGIVSTMSGGEKGIRDRISLIAKKQKYIAAAAVLVVVIVLGLTVVTFSGKIKEEGGSETGGLKAKQEESIGSLEQTEALIELKETEEAQAAALEAALKEELAQYDEDEAVLEELRQMNTADGIYMPEHDYTDQGYGEETQLTKGLYLLYEGLYVPEDGQDAGGCQIRIYGMYTEEYGCEGIRIVIDEKSNDFALPWPASGIHGWENNFRIYENGNGNSPKTIAFQMQTVNTSDSEIWQLYLCDCDDTGNINLAIFAEEDYIAQMKERLDFKIAQSEGKVYVYDNGREAGAIVLPDTMAAKKIESVVVDGTSIGWSLGGTVEELRLLTCVGLKLEDGMVWYQGLNLLSFPVSCGSVGDRNFQLGKAAVEKNYVCGMRQQVYSEEMVQGICQLPKVSAYLDPCPDAGRISNPFGSRVHPVTGEVSVHDGIDYAAEAGTDILAAADGVVYETGFDVEKGNYVILFHSAGGEYTHYQHCSEILVKEGDDVSAGTRIATVGSTGKSTGAHLHFAVEREGTFVEPYFGS